MSPVVVDQIGKRVGPKIVRMMGSKTGKDALKKFLMKKVSAKVATSIIAGGGWLSLLTGAIGVGWAAKDIYQFVRDFKE